MNLHFLKEKNINVCMIKKKIKTQTFNFVMFGQTINKLLNKKIDICAMFRTKHGLNKMHPSMCS